MTLYSDIEAAIAETEKMAQDAAFEAGQFWSVNDERYSVTSGGPRIGSDVLRSYFPGVRRFSASHDPASVLEQCMTDRIILRLCQDADDEKGRSQWDQGFYQATHMILEVIARRYGITEKDDD